MIVDAKKTTDGKIEGKRSSLASYHQVSVSEVKHWNGSYFSFRTTRPHGIDFLSGQFVMVSLPQDGGVLTVDGQRVARAYSIASPPTASCLEFFSVVARDKESGKEGALTSRLKLIKPGDTVLVQIMKGQGNLIVDSVLAPGASGRNLYLLATGTGLAPFLSLAADVSGVLERFEKVVIVHSNRTLSDLAYRETLSRRELDHETYYYDDQGKFCEYTAEHARNLIREKLIYHPTVSREEGEFIGYSEKTRARFIEAQRLEDFVSKGRITDLLGFTGTPEEVVIPGDPASLEDNHPKRILTGETLLTRDINFRALATEGRLLNIAPMDPRYDRVMVCGCLDMLNDTQAILLERGFTLWAKNGPASFVREIAFADKKSK